MVNVLSATYLTPAAAWPDIVQLEDGWWPTGGVVDPAADSGLMNWQARDLTARSHYLRDMLQTSGLDPSNRPAIPSFTVAQKNGIYTWDSSQPAAPPVGVGGAVLSISGGAGLAGLMAIAQAGAVGVNSPRLAVRNTSGNPNDWGTWGEAWLGQQATQTLAANGYQRMPSGLILQWGHFAGTTLAGNVVGGVYESSMINIVWPITFPSNCFCVVGGAASDVGGVGMQEQAWVLQYTNSHCNFMVSARAANATLTGRYLAIGV